MNIRPISLVSCLASLVTAAVHAAPPGAATPYMFVGRVMDASRAGFDTNRVCTLTTSDADGTPLVQTTTFFRESTRNNYALRVPVATAEADGFALKGDPLTVTAVDDKGKVWEGVIPESFCGEPGGVREVDIVLGEDADGDGLDDALLDQLLAQWEASDFWKPGAEFNPRDDHDGDGVSTLDEAFDGTDPFNGDEVFAITSCSSGTNGASVTFSTAAGRAYGLQTASDLDAADWSPTTPPTTLATPASDRSSRATLLYLLPSTNRTVFFRVVAE